MGKFVVSVRSNGEYQFALQAGNGQTILASEGYNGKAGCINGIESIRKNSQDSTYFDRKTATNGKHYFTLKAGNGQVIGTSQMYEGVDGMENGIKSVITNVPDAAVEEL